MRARESTPEPYSMLCQAALEQALAQLMPFQQVAKVEDGTRIRYGLRQLQTGKAPHRFRLIQQVLTRPALLSVYHNLSIVQRFPKLERYLAMGWKFSSW